VIECCAGVVRRGAGRGAVISRWGMAAGVGLDYLPPPPVLVRRQAGCAGGRLSMGHGRKGQLIELIAPCCSTPELWRIRRVSRLVAVVENRPSATFLSVSERKKIANVVRLGTKLIGPAAVICFVPPRALFDDAVSAAFNRTFFFSASGEVAEPLLPLRRLTDSRRPALQ